MRVLVFGGTGMLGRALAAEGRRRRKGVLALSRAQADVADPERLAYWVDAFDPGVVVNCAAFTRVDDCESEEWREHARAINGEAVANVAAAAARRRALLVQVSSDYVFSGQVSGGQASGGLGERPYREDDATGPLSVYGASKLLGEERALEYDRTLVVRASWLFGPGGPSFPATMHRLIREGRTPLRVVDDQIGAPTYTPYLARAIWDLAAADTRGKVHYRNRPRVSWHGFAREIATALDPEVEVRAIETREMPRPAPRPAYSVLDPSRFERLVGRSVEPWIAGLTDFLDTMRDSIP